MFARISSSISGSFKATSVTPVNGGDERASMSRSSSRSGSFSERSFSERSAKFKDGISSSLNNLRNAVKRKSSKANDLDKSDVGTRNQHNVVYRSDGRAVIRALNSSNDVVKKFRLRSNSVQESSEGGALQAALIEEDNKRLRVEAKRKGLVMPNDPNLKTWRLFMLAMTFWQVFFAPWNWGFNPSLAKSVEWFEHFSDLMFLVDFGLKFLMTKKDKKTGLLITKKKILWGMYLRSWFWLDLITCFPLDKVFWLMYGRQHYDESYLTQLNKMGRALRFYRMSELYKIIEQLDHASTSWFFFSSAAHFLKLFIVILSTLIFAHYGGCMWYATAWVGGDAGWNFWKQRSFCIALYQDEGFAMDVINDESMQPLRPTITTSLNRMYGDLSQLRTQDECMDEGEGQQVWDEYTNSLLASILLFLTGENLEPVTDHEKLVQSMYLLTGIFVIALLYGNVHALVSNILMRSSNYQRKMETIYDAMNRMNLPKELQDRIFFYYDYLHKEHGTLDGSVVGFVPEVSKKLQAEVYLWQRFNLIKGVKFFENIHPKVIQDIVVKLEVEVFLPGDYIISHGDYGDSMYFIYTGQCEVIVPMSKEEIERKENYEKRKSEGGVGDGRRKSSISNMLSTTLSTIKVGRKLSSEVNASASKSEEDADKDVLPEGEGRESGSDLDSSRDSGRPSAQSSRRATSAAINALNSIKNMTSTSKARPLATVDPVKLKPKLYKIVATLKAGQHFGEVALVLHSKRTASIRSKGCCEVCVLTKEVYDRVAGEYPQDAFNMKNIILAKYGNLDHSKKSVLASVKNEKKREEMEEVEEVEEVDSDPDNAVAPKRPSMVGKGAGSSTSTTASTPSTNMSRANSSLRSLDSDPDSPSRNLKLATDNFKVDLRAVDKLYDSLFDEEIAISKGLEDLGVELYQLLKTN